MVESYEIREATAEDSSQVKALWAYCFHNDSDAFRNWYFDAYYRHKECLVAISVSGQILGSLQLIATEFKQGDYTYHGAYVVGVDVLPEARDAHVGRALMAKAHEKATAEGLDFLFLMPFEAGFYEPLGYAFFDYHGQVNLPLSELKKAPVTGEFEKMSLEENQTKRLKELYEKWQTCYYDGFIQRTERHYNALVSDVRLENGYGYFYRKNGQDKGYLFYIIQGEEFYLREMAYIDEESYQALLQFIRNHSSQVTRLTWSAPFDTPLVANRPKDKENVIYSPFMMVKILNEKRFLEQEIVVQEPLCFNVKQADGEIKTWQLRMGAAGKTHAEQGEAAKAQFTITEKTLHKLVFGRFYQEQLAPVDVQEISAWRYFSRAFSPKKYYINEYF